MTGNDEAFDEIELKIMSCLNGLVTEADEKNYKGDSVWTTRIKEILTDLGHSEGFEVCPDSCSGAWLFDLSWYEENSNERLISIPLVVESEWNRGLRHIRYDFEKLLSSNAERRLMICQAKTNMIEPLFQYFEDAISDYNRSKVGDRYLIAILDDFNSGEFIYRLLVKQPAKLTNETLSIEPLVN